MRHSANSWSGLVCARPDRLLMPLPQVASQTVTDRARRALRLIASLPVFFYQRVISPALPQRCRYAPTCSRYATQAIQEYGILRGSVLAGWRLLRCNPWSRGGYDPVAAQRLFSRTGHTQC
ncbi:MAG TPA: membrane protein insertion efficiency factor YidD [Solirubrobacteraceae bacterium]